MSFDNLRRRLDRIKRRTGGGPSSLGRFPAVQIVTESDEDRDRQLAALTKAGKYQPDRFLIEFRIVRPDPRMKEMWFATRPTRPSPTAH